MRHNNILMRLISTSGLLLCVSLAHSQVVDDGRSNLHAAIAAGNWIRHHQIETDHGLVWPVVPDESEDVERNLYAGTPGVILFFLELGKATGDQSWIDDAKRGADDLLAGIPDDLSEANPALWTGLAGQGFTLHRTYLATKDEQYLRGANKIVDLLKTGAKQDGERVRWNEVTDIIGGSAGIGLFLIYAANEMDDPDSLMLAVKAGNDLITQGRVVEIASDKRGLRWAMTDEYPRLMPNFSHGTAGICYFLATLHQELGKRDQAGDDRFLHAAEAGTAYLLTIAMDEPGGKGGFKVFHHEPEGEELFYLGWCHGPVGTSRLFTRLGQIEGGSIWSRMVERSANSVMTSGIPKQRPDGFWENVGPCCGSAGVGSYFLDLNGDKPRQEYVQFALAMNDDIMNHATKVELPGGVTGLKWIHAEHRVRPDFLQAQTGYMQGAAGIGLWLLQLDAFENGRKFDLRFPDSPY